MNRTESINQLIRLAAVAWMAGACSQPLTVEQQVIATIRDMESSIESGERRPFIAHVDKDFSGQDAVMTRDQLNAMVLYQLNRHERVHVQLLPIQVVVKNPGEAEAYFDVLLTGGSGWLPDSGQMLNVVTGWRLVDGDWLLRTASWKPVNIEPGRK
jgi:hypothetical protein